MEGGGGAKSSFNAEEANQIRHWLQALEATLSLERHEKPLRVGVISGYGAQKDLLHKRIIPDSEEWKALHIEINSVDAFQGRQVGLLVYSVTRSNSQGDIGFLRSSACLNVALGRGRDALVIFGDAAHCRASTGGGNPFPQVLDYIETHPDSCAIEFLQEIS